MDSNGLKSANLIDDFQDTTKENTYDSCLVSSERNNVRDAKKKRVKFTEQIIFIDVECWKKYNEELTADENFTFQNDGENDDNNKNNSQNNDSNKRNKKKDNIVCTCNVI